MARKRNSLKFKISAILRQFSLALICVLFILLTQGELLLVFASEQHQAQQLTEMGHKQLQRGESKEALYTWEAATKIYRAEGNSLQITGSLINESLALKELGLHYRACQTLVQALELEDWVCTSPIENSGKYITQISNILQKQSNSFRLGDKERVRIQIIGLGNLGNILRLVGQPERSEIVLLHAISLAKNFSNSSLKIQLLLSLANTERTLYNQAKNKYQLISEPILQQKARLKAKSKLEKASKLYKEILTFDGEQDSTILITKVNQLSLFLEQLEWEEINNSDLNYFKYQDSLQQYVKQILSYEFNNLSGIESVYTQMNFVSSLIKINQHTALKRILMSDNIKPLSVALLNSNNAYIRANKLNNKRALSYTLEVIGDIYSYQDRFINSQQYLSKALSLAKSIQAEDIAYSLQQKLGRLYQKRGFTKSAEKMYAGAINSLEEVRGSIMSINPEFQFNFKEKIEPVYREYMDLLLSQPSANFRKVIQIEEELKLAELENFLQCGKLNISNNSNFEKLTTASPIIYLINLSTQVEIIIKTPDGKFHHHTADKELVTKDINNLRNIIQSDKFFEIQEEYFLTYSQNLYKEIIAPIKKYLPFSGDLVFVLDNFFQNVPISMLHNGKNYLLESYKISIALNSQLTQTRAFINEPLKVLFAGISKSNPSLKKYPSLVQLNSLPEVEEEVLLVKENTTNMKLLLNEKFTNAHFQQVISEKSKFPIVHISTHGQFSSDPEKTFILAWDEPINVRRFESLIRNHQVPIELLTLSACQTAKGDQRSALGIAGVAVMSGARRTLATLWLVDSQSTTLLMGNFYQGLKNGLNESEALRKAQLSLLREPKYSHPYYWAPFILVSR